MKTMTITTAMKTLNLPDFVIPARIISFGLAGGFEL